jgi:hypothetical protein
MLHGQGRYRVILMAVVTGGKEQGDADIRG